MRTILVLLDGLGDKGMKELGGKTPLQAAHTPNMDAIAEAGVTGLYHSTRQGMAMPSEMAHFVIFGYDLADFPGRGYIEAVGSGLTVEAEDVALLARMFHVEPVGREYILRREKVSVGAGERDELCRVVSPYRARGMELTLHPTGGNGGIAVVRGGAVPEITDSNPIYENRPIMAVQPRRGAADPERAACTADFLNDYTLWTYEELKRHPVNQRREAEGQPPLNMVTMQRPGQYRRLPTFRDAWGLRALCIASGSIYHGLCSILGMDVESVRDSGDCGRDLLERLQRACRAREHEYIYVHTKAPDEAAHRGDPRAKLEVIEALDRALAWVVERVLPDEDVVFVLTSDHSTASGGTMIHSGEPVPLVMSGRYARKDGVRRFDEISCAQGALGQVRGNELMYMILNLLDRGKLQGLMDSPVNQPYFPGRYTSLRRRT
ncbi:MAG: 2,3-bisphosphoglycerate-independent phosphoglycerate mutase [Synergistales bacterium]|nr:2,3-bisphosphoglycerate-independent phosphoglycerate mutase [Synergistales bacterium]